MKRAIWLAAVFGLIMTWSGGAIAREPKAAPGYVVASFRDRGGIPQKLEVTQVGTYKTYMVTPSIFGPYSNNPEGGGSAVTSQKLPPGKYWASTLYVTSSGLSGQLHFGYSFTVESGKITYIGEIRPILIMGKRLGYPMPTSFNASMSDEMARDMPIAMAKLPPGLPVLNQAPGQPTLVGDLK